MNVIYMESTEKFICFYASIVIKIPVFRISVTIEPNHCLRIFRSDKLFEKLQLRCFKMHSGKTLEMTHYNYVFHL